MRQGWDFLRTSELDERESLALAPLDGRSFSEWVEDLLRAQKLRRNEVVRASRLNQTFAYQIMAGTRKASRDKLIQLAFGLRLKLDAASELLERGGVSALVPWCRRDVLIALSLERGQSVLECDDALWAAGERTLVTRGPVAGI